MASGSAPTIITDHYWLKPDGNVFGSAAQTSVATSDAAYLAWVARGNTATKYPGDAALRAVLAPAYIGLSSTETTQRRLIQNLTQRGFLYGTQATPIVNGYVSGSIDSGSLILSLKTAAGNTPSAEDPVYIFCSELTTSGTYTVVTVTSAVTFAPSSGSTMGAANGVPFRLWVVAINDAGTIRLGAINCRTGGSGITTKISALTEQESVTSVAEGGAGAADSAGVIYTTAAATVKPMRILAMATFSIGLATAGTWTTAPIIHQVGHGCPRPNDIVQRVYAETSSSSTSNSATFAASNLSGSITPTSACNIIKVTANAAGSHGAVGDHLYLELRRGASTTVGVKGIMNSNASLINVLQPLFGFDHPGVATATTYAVYIAIDGVGTGVYYPQSSYGTPYGNILLEEIMG